MCVKKSFDTAVKAKLACEKIAEKNKKVGDKRKPTYYLCHCRKWHLTSMSKQEYRIQFLEQETQYWEKRLNIQ